MARLFVTDINLNQNELQNARVQNLSSDPISPVAGQIYFNNTVNELRFYDGNAWIAGGSVKFGTTVNRPPASKSGTLYVDTQAKVLYIDNGQAWIQGTLNESDVQGWIQDHNLLTTGVHGVTGNVVGTSDTQTLSNKTISDNLHFNAGGGNVGRIYDNNNNALVIQADALSLQATDYDITLETNSGNIVLNPDGDAYIGSVGANNRIVTVADLESNTVVQSVTGTLNEVEVTDDGAGNVTVGLPDNVQVTTTFGAGQQTGPYSTLEVDGTVDTVRVNGNLELRDANAGQTSRVYTNQGNDLVVEAYNNLILNPDGNAYIGSNNQPNKIVTEGGSATLTNKTIGDQLTFNDGSNDSAIDVDGNNLYVNANNNLSLNTANGNITLNPDGHTQVNGELKAGDVVTGWIYGNETNGNIDIADWNENSAIHIDGTTHNIELLPGNGGKAFYGSAATSGNEIAKLSDLQALSSGLNWKQAVNLLASTPQNFSVDNVGHSIDGHAAFTLANAGYRILLTGQTNTTENGIYELYVDGSTLLGRRAADADTDAELKGAAVFVMEGNTYANTSWVQNNHYISGFANQSWIQFSGQGTYIGSDSIYLDGRSINVVADTTRGLNIDGDGTFVKIGDGIQYVNGNVSINPGTGFDTTSGQLNFATGYGVRKFSTDLSYAIADGSHVTYTVTHNFNTKDVTVQVYDNSAPFAQVEADVEHGDNSVTIRFASAPTDSQYRVVVIG